MSPPLTSLPTASTEPDAPEPTAEAQEIQFPRDDAETDAPGSQDPPSKTHHAEAPRPAEGEKADKSGRGLITLALAVLLLGSVAINLKQSRDLSILEIRGQEYQQALAAAVERIDAEVARADGAEAALGRVDEAVSVVNQQMVGLSQALDHLRDATQR